MTDPIERLRAANPLPDCRPPSIDDVWRRLELADAHEPRISDASTARRPARVRRPTVAGSLPLLLSALVAAGITVAAIATLGHRQHTTDASPPAGSPHRLLVQSLGVLRRPQTSADRRSIRTQARGGGQLPAFLTARPPQVCRSSEGDLVPGCGLRLDTALVRTVGSLGPGDRAAIFPVTATRTTHDVHRGELGVVLSVTGPEIGVAQSSPSSSSAGGQANSGPTPTSVQVLRARGVIVSFDVGAAGHTTTGVNRAAILVPDGVVTVTLDDLWLTSPRTGRRLARLPSTTATVHHNVALLELSGLTEQHLHVDLGRLGGGHTSGHGCAVSSIIDAVPATAQMVWRHIGHESAHRTTVRFSLYVNARTAAAAHPDSARCRVHR